MFNFVHLPLLEERNSDGEEGIPVTCNRAAKQSLRSLTFLFSLRLGKNSLL